MQFNQIRQHVEIAERMVDALQLKPSCEIVVMDGPFEKYGHSLVMIGVKHGATKEDYRAGMMVTTGRTFESEAPEKLIQDMIDTLVFRLDEDFPGLPLNPEGTRPKALVIRDLDACYLAVEGVIHAN